MKIGVIGAKGMPSRVSGLEVHVDYVAKGLAKAGNEVVVFARKRYCTEIVKKYEGMQIQHIPSINSKHLDAISYSFFATIVALIKKCDIFWFHALGPAVMAWLPHLFGKRVICTVHGLDWKRQKFGKIASYVLELGEKCIAKFADEIIVLSENDASHFLNKYGRKCNIISNGVEIKQKRPAKEIIDKYKLEEQEYFLFASRIVPEKNLECLIKAYLKTNCKKKLVIAGKGVHTNNYEHEMRMLAEDSPNIIFAGFAEGSCLEELYSNAYAYILPSTIEGQSIGLLEAMSYGNACLVSDIPENVSVIKDAGMSFKNNDSESLSEMLEFLVLNKSEVIRMGRRAQEVCRTNYRWEETIHQTILVFGKVGEKNGRTKEKY